MLSSSMQMAELLEMTNEVLLKIKLQTKEFSS
jgi:hypothetical protein